MKIRLAISIFAGAPLLMGAAAASYTGQALLAQVPPLPATADQAYAQWADHNGDLQEGAGFAAVERNLLAAQANVPGVQTAQANANALAQRYGTPQGQAELQNMTTAQKMALAQQLAGQFNPGVAGPATVSPQDQVLVRQANPYPQMAEVRTKMQWQNDDRALDNQEAADRAKLKACPGEAGEPSDIGVRNVARAYAPKHAALAQTYLAKFAPLIQQVRQTLLPEIVYDDNAVAAWNKIQNPTLKAQVQSAAAAAANGGIQDVTQLTGFIAAPSKFAAEQIAKQNAMERRFANAKGC